MNCIKRILLLLIAQALCIGAAFSQTHATAAEAKALAEKAVAYIKSAGPDKAFEEFSNKDAKWQDRDLYVFVVKFDGTTVAHGGNKALVGKNLNEMKDANGKFFLREMGEVAKARSTGWVDYHWTNPQTKKVEPKSSFVAAIPGFDGYVGVGIYK
jgi:signal transduction histidine kinase